MIAIIAAVSQNMVIGDKGRIPWSIKGEQKRFKDLTTGNVVVMGRRSFEEIGRPLPNRYTIVVSNSAEYEMENCTTAGSLPEALKKAKEMMPEADIYISGGAGLYKEALGLVKKIYLTEIHKTFSGDTFFPEFDESMFDKELIAYFDEEMPYTYVTYTRK